jgi:hypothetical protein
LKSPPLDFIKKTEQLRRSTSPSPVDIERPLVMISSHQKLDIHIHHHPEPPLFVPTVETDQTIEYNKLKKKVEEL